jgi:hypothetical protein
VIGYSLFVVGEEEEGFFKAGTFVPKGPLNESSMKMPLHGSAGILPASAQCATSPYRVQLLEQSRRTFRDKGPCHVVADTHNSCIIGLIRFFPTSW